MKAHFQLASMVVMAFGAGCLTTEVERGEEPTAAFVSGRTDVRVIEDTGETWVISPPLLPEGRYGYQVSLMARWMEEEVPRFQVYLFSRRIEWAWFDQALSAEGDILEIESVERQVGGPNAYEERVICRVPESMLEAGADGGLDLVFRGRGGQQAVEIPGFFVGGFLDRVRKLRD